MVLITVAEMAEPVEDVVVIIDLILRINIGVQVPVDLKAETLLLLQMEQIKGMAVRDKVKQP